MSTETTEAIELSIAQITVQITIQGHAAGKRRLPPGRCGRLDRAAAGCWPWLAGGRACTLAFPWQPVWQRKRAHAILRIARPRSCNGQANFELNLRQTCKLFVSKFEGYYLGTSARRVRHAPAAWNSRMRLRRAWHGMSCLLSSSAPVAGEVLWVLSHCSMALRS
eukprot:scaffold40124_cov65-Phaeocystis_antarctica.AAC.5